MIGAVGKPDVCPDAPTAPFGSFLGQSPSAHGRLSPPSSVAPHPLPPAANAYPGLSAARSRSIRPRIAANNARGTARDAKRGLWSQPNPVPPWEWRKTKGEALPGELAGKFIGNRRSRVYHKPGCPNAASISPGNRMPFNSAGAAEAAGFRPGKDCLNR